MNNTVTIQSVTYFPNDIALVTGLVNNQFVTTQVWQSAITQQALNASNFLGQALINSIPSSGIIINDFNGIVTLQGAVQGDLVYGK